MADLVTASGESGVAGGIPRDAAFRPVRAKAASRGIPLAAALQIRSPDLRSIGIEINCSF
ncbi:MAG: hypothetical protein PHE10_07790 [Kiritimatiellae bacterium]|nr:hypothetical protein [Kiritimatiellia bacterium]